MPNSYVNPFFNVSRNATTQELYDAFKLPYTINGVPHNVGVDLDPLPSGLTIEPRTSDPVTPYVGRIWLRTDL
jgi:hypothetical protein